MAGPHAVQGEQPCVEPVALGRRGDDQQDHGQQQHEHAFPRHGRGPPSRAAARLARRGGAGAQLFRPGRGGVIDVRQEFPDTAYWEAYLVTGENGEAQVTVTLPDNLTTWRLDARAVTDGRDGITLVGQTTVDLISTRPLLVRPVGVRQRIRREHCRLFLPLLLQIVCRLFLS